MQSQGNLVFQIPYKDLPSWAMPELVTVLSPSMEYLIQQTSIELSAPRRHWTRCQEYSHPPDNLQFHFPWFQLSMVNPSSKVLNVKPLKHTIHKFSTVCHSEQHDNLSPVLFLPTWDVNHPFVRLFLPVSHIVAISVIRLPVTVLQCLCSSHSILLNSNPKA